MRGTFFFGMRVFYNCVKGAVERVNGFVKAGAIYNEFKRIVLVLYKIIA